MTFKGINITAAIEESRKALKESKDLPPSIVACMSTLLLLVELMYAMKLKGSKNSSTPPSQDPNRDKKAKEKTGRKPGGQKGREGRTLKLVDNPDEVIPVPVDRKTLPEGAEYENAGIIRKQVIELIMRRHIKEYQYEILKDQFGNEYTTSGVLGKNSAQYGNTVKTAAIYMSLYQLVPYNRVEEYFSDQFQIPISVGSLFNFNEEAYNRLEAFEKAAKQKLINASCLHADETSINLGGKRIWLHSASNDKYTLFDAHDVRGLKAMDTMGILPNFKGVMVHDHWKPYFTYKQCQHALCNAHHLRELQAVIDIRPESTWAQEMKDFLIKTNDALKETSDGCFDDQSLERYKTTYRSIIAKGETQAPLALAPEPPAGTKRKRGKIKQSKERNLLDRLRNFEAEVFRCFTISYVPFTNNQSENDIRMTKVHQKISGCFRSLQGAKIFCRVRSYLLTSRKHGLSATDALDLLFNHKLPDFCLPD